MHETLQFKAMGFVSVMAVTPGFIIGVERGKSLLSTRRLLHRGTACQML